jgi:hypothetical protein
VFLALLSRFVGTYSCAVIRVKSGGRRAAEDRETEETEERQRDSVSNDAQNGALSGVELASQEFWAWLAHLVCIAPALFLSLSLRRSLISFFLDLFVRLMMSLLDAKSRASFGEQGILGGS